MLLRVKGQLPEKVQPLFKPKRYKSLRGGRGSAKSHSVARVLLLLGMQRPLRILCTRETQTSIRESCHKLLSDLVKKMGLQDFYTAEVRTITGKNGTEFIFAGLSDLTAESLKSIEDVDIVWIEEGQVLSAGSWEILVPTIRKDGSEIWVTWNPQLDTDPTWKQLVEDKDDDVLDIIMNWRDNPWFTSVLEKERQKAQRKMSKIDYENIWEGVPRPAVKGAIYADEIAKLYADGRVGTYKHDPYLLTYPVFDLGWNDSMSIGFWQRAASSLRLIDHIRDDHKTYAWYSQEMRKKPYNWGTVFLPHDGKHADPKSGQSAEQVMQGLGWEVVVLANTDVAEGIRQARMQFEQLYVNKEPCENWLESMKRYRRTIPTTTGEPGNPVHDQHSHDADMYRYAVEAAPQMTNSQGLKLPSLKYGPTGVC